MIADVPGALRVARRVSSRPVDDRIYLDHQSTTPIDPRVVEAVAPFGHDQFGHPSSSGHAFGWDAEKAVEHARAQVADLVGAEPREIVFTSGGTEADNLAIKGVAEALASKGRHIVTTAVENRPVLDSCAWLETRGWEVTRVAPDAKGRVEAEAIGTALRPDTVLVSVQYANHEVGTVQPVAGIAAVVAEHGAWLHTDAAQALAWLPVDVATEGIHLLSLAAHRMYGPKGAGALYVRRRKPRVRVAPQMHGGGHERGLRSGTVNVPGVVGLGAAAAACRADREGDAARVAVLRDRLEARIAERVSGMRRFGDLARRLPNNTNVAFEGVEGESLVVALPEIAFATGSACTSATLEPSYVLPAMGVAASTAAGSVRFSLGRFTTEAEIDRTVARVVEAVERTRALDPRR